jgi:hypothetical protein
MIPPEPDRPPVPMTPPLPCSPPEPVAPPLAPELPPLDDDDPEESEQDATNIAVSASIEKRVVMNRREGIVFSNAIRKMSAPRRGTSRL